jgi:archaellum component FlaC
VEVIRTSERTAKTGKNGLYRFRDPFRSFFQENQTSTKEKASTMKTKLDQIKADIEQLRDEIKLKAHLGKAEATDEIEKLEKRWESFLSQYKPVADEVEKTAENTGAALGVVADELKAGYKRLRKLL